MRTKYRLGIDAGGTFTDLVLADQSGDVRLYKALSTPADPTRAIEEGMKLIADDLGESPAEIVANSDLCINGTTVGLNALIQHKGGKTGLQKLNGKPGTYAANEGISIRSISDAAKDERTAARS